MARVPPAGDAPPAPAPAPRVSCRTAPVARPATSPTTAGREVSRAPSFRRSRRDCQGGPVLMPVLAANEVAEATIGLEDAGAHEPERAAQQAGIVAPAELEIAPLVGIGEHQVGDEK